MWVIRLAEASLARRDTSINALVQNPRISNLFIHQTIYNTLVVTHHFGVGGNPQYTLTTHRFYFTHSPVYWLGARELVSSWSIVRGVARL